MLLYPEQFLRPGSKILMPRYSCSSYGQQTKSPGGRFATDHHTSGADNDFALTHVGSAEELGGAQHASSDSSSDSDYDEQLAQKMKQRGSFGCPGSDPDSFLSASAAVMVSSSAVQPQAMLTRHSSTVTEDSKDSAAKLVSALMCTRFMLLGSEVSHVWSFLGALLARASCQPVKGCLHGYMLKPFPGLWAALQCAESIDCVQGTSMPINIPALGSRFGAASPENAAERMHEPFIPPHLLEQAKVGAGYLISS